MRTTLIRTTTFAAIFMLPLALPHSPHSGDFAAMFSLSKASADGTFNRFMRWTGYGWSSGYHTCNQGGQGLRDALPPVGNTARQSKSASYGKFELVAPNQSPACSTMHSGGHAIHGHYHSPMTHYSDAESMPSSAAPMGAPPFNQMGGSLVVPHTPQPGGVFQPYRSVVPPKSPNQPAAKSEDREEASPPDLESLPAPNGKRTGPDDLLREDNSAQLTPQRNRSAWNPRPLRSR